MRNIYLILLFIFFGLSLQCKNNKEKESEQVNIAKEKETKEIKQIEENFNLIKPTNKPKEPLYKTIYNDYTISINSNPSYQEIIFTKGDLKISKVLKFYYENPEIVFHVYESNFGNIVLLIEGRDYYSSNLGIYYIENELNEIIEIDDTINYRQDNPETKGFKLPKAQVIKNDINLRCKIYLGDNFLFDKSYNISEIIGTEKNKKSGDKTIRNKINKYLNNEDYFIKTFDVNKDGIEDKIVSHNRYQGDELLIFIGDSSSNYNFLLKTTNFSEDGGNQISNITVTEQGFKITTLFPDKGSYEKNYYIIFKNNSFILNTLETLSTSWQDGYKETCTKTNLDYNLNDSISIDGLLNILSKTVKNCVKTKF